MKEKELAHIKKRVKDRKATFKEVDQLVKELDYWKGKAASYHFLLQQIWKDDPILNDATTPDLLADEPALKARIANA